MKGIFNALSGTMSGTMSAMNAFDLKFAALNTGLDRAEVPPPEISVSKPEAGWIRLRVHGDGAVLVARMSYLYPPFVPLWAWAAAIAHRLLPVSVRIDEEGCHTELSAEQEEDADCLRITVRQIDAHGQEWNGLTWREARQGWLIRIGDTFSHYFQGTFEQREWRLGLGLWPEPGQYLPWRWPAAVTERLASNENDWPSTELRAWFFVTLARQLDPFVLRAAWGPDHEEEFARLQYLLALLRREALTSAWAEMDRPTPQLSHLDRRIQDAQDLLEELEMLRETGTPTRLELTDRLWRNRALRSAAWGFEEELHALERETITELFIRLPLAPGRCLIDEKGRPGRVAFSEGYRLVIDWGETGLTTEYGLHCGFRSTWRWPIAEPRNFVSPDTPIFRRWRIFSTSPQTMRFHVCPCCGYPHLDDEPMEIQDCLLCGWPLYFTLHDPLPDLDQPISPGDLPSLRESRRHFETHGDAFAPDDDSENTEWLRRKEVAALRKHVIAQFDSWLADPLRDDHPLIQEDWRRLEGGEWESDDQKNVT
ncbi:MAG: hypothetical protein M0R18_08125 [Deltaproteobacteria bacterium]|nr:hypothetical protein [Deltaproteobacteria bacterium]MCK9502045.1 hypothetical protein [Lascolabacillus sp.]